jgi:hypothetical protein
MLTVRFHGLHKSVQGCHRGFFQFILIQQPDGKGRVGTRHADIVPRQQSFVGVAVYRQKLQLPQFGFTARNAPGFRKRQDVNRGVARHADIHSVPAARLPAHFQCVAFAIGRGDRPGNQRRVETVCVDSIRRVRFQLAAAVQSNGGHGGFQHQFTVISKAGAGGENGNTGIVLVNGRYSQRINHAD